MIVYSLHRTNVLGPMYLDQCIWDHTRLKIMGYQTLFYHFLTWEPMLSSGAAYRGKDHSLVGWFWWWGRRGGGREKMVLSFFKSGLDGNGTCAAGATYLDAPVSELSIPFDTRIPDYLAGRCSSLDVASWQVRNGNVDGRQSSSRKVGTRSNLSHLLAYCTSTRCAPEVLNSLRRTMTT